MIMKRSVGLLALMVACPSLAAAQTALPPQQFPTPVAQPSPVVQQPYPYAAPVSNTRSSAEITTLYATSAVYGVGLGVWIGSEAHIKDPGLFLIAPAILGVAGPVGVYLLDNPSLPRGVPGAIASGLVIGAGEGIGIASYQFVSSGS
jgi:hypothetical protein